MIHINEHIMASSRNVTQEVDIMAFTENSNFIENIILQALNTGILIPK